MSARQTDLLQEEIKKMLKYQVIEIGESDYASTMILVETPGRDPRPCIDYRKLNEVIRTQFYPLQNIGHRIETVTAAKYITLVDLTKGYWQIPLTPKAQRLAAFTTSFGTYRPLRMPFGLKNAPYYFSRLMAELLQECEKFALPYLDNVAIFSEKWDDLSLISHIDKVLERIQTVRLTIKPVKCKFAQDSVKYLGHVTDHNPLVRLKTNAGTNPRLMYWSLALQPFNFEVIHKPGRSHANVDALSRID
ncbi:retrovirus-related Pol polyprotein from transposon 412 [Trichonephila clavata]|uniref:Retrovirus-related Pol polyprotein from transposon 412 n=1 Tax=Trichonephila clavata TaxID=2740835 RepID=A0A8X6LCC7_TRICU|nr:retrovirus-related Pol polyprotein from transposon 412 [Trichonephila clavata]